VWRYIAPSKTGRSPYCIGTTGKVALFFFLAWGGPGIAFGWAGNFSTTLTSGETGCFSTGPCSVSGTRFAPALENPPPGWPAGAGVTITFADGAGCTCV